MIPSDSLRTCHGRSYQYQTRCFESEANTTTKSTTVAFTSLNVHSTPILSDTSNSATFPNPLGSIKSLSRAVAGSFYPSPSANHFINHSYRVNTGQYPWYYILTSMSHYMTADTMWILQGRQFIHSWLGFLVDFIPFRISIDLYHSRRCPKCLLVLCKYWSICRGNLVWNWWDQFSSSSKFGNDDDHGHPKKSQTTSHFPTTLPNPLQFSLHRSPPL